MILVRPSISGIKITTEPPSISRLFRIVILRTQINLTTYICYQKPIKSSPSLCYLCEQGYPGARQSMPSLSNPGNVAASSLASFATPSPPRQSLPPLQSPSSSAAGGLDDDITTEWYVLSHVVTRMLAYHSPPAPPPPCKCTLPAEFPRSFRYKDLLRMCLLDRYVPDKRKLICLSFLLSPLISCFFPLHIHVVAPVSRKWIHSFRIRSVTEGTKELKDKRR